MAIGSSERQQPPEPELPEHVRTGVYANIFHLSLSETDAFIDFGQLSRDPIAVGTSESGPAKADREVVVARVIMSRQGLQRLAQLIQQMTSQPSPQ